MGGGNASEGVKGGLGMGDLGIDALAAPVKAV
jgi:hypothetical protein